MARRTKLLAAAATLATAAATSISVLTPASATTPTYTVTVGSVTAQGLQQDTPDAGYFDKDGTFYIQGSHSLYGATDPRGWQWWTGTTFDNAADDTTLDTSVNPNNPKDRNGDTTWRCNNSPTGVTATYETHDATFAERNYCDLVGTWVDPDTGNWYGLVHNEFTPEPFPGVSFDHYDAIDYTESTDQGKTWTVLGHAITSPYSTRRNDTTAFPNQTFDYGDGDPRLFVDTASGYFYAYYGTRIQNKNIGGGVFLAHVARAPISGKMATGTWQKWYNGAWSQPGVGGLESNMVPNGYTPVSADYNPRNTGTTAQQVAAGTLPATSPLFVMDITYDAYLGLYIGEPQAVDQSGNAPQQYYATSNLATQKWTLIGDTGGYHTASWYRWLVDTANRTLTNTVVGKTFRAYCSFGCSHGSSGEYANVTINSNSPAAPPVDTGKTYTIAAGDGRLLAQVSGTTATTSEAASTGSGLEQWIFTADGDGSYRITNTATGQALGVGSTATATRAWGAAPTATTLGASGPTVGQQWWIITDTSPSPSGTFRLIDRYSGLALALSAASGRLAETTPTRTWTDTTGNAVGGGRTAAEQTLTLTPTGPAAANLNGTHVLTISGGQALDDPNWSQNDLTQLVTWQANGGTNQNWTFTQQTDGTYEIRNAYSGKCVDDANWSTTSGSQVIQYTCTAGPNQRWIAAKQPDGTYTLANAYSGLLLTTASTGQGALVTQQANSGSALQYWIIN